MESFCPYLALGSGFILEWSIMWGQWCIMVSLNTLGIIDDDSWWVHPLKKNRMPIIICFAHALGLFGTNMGWPLHRLYMGDRAEKVTPCHIVLMRSCLSLTIVEVNDESVTLLFFVSYRVVRNRSLEGTKFYDEFKWKQYIEWLTWQ